MSEIKRNGQRKRRNEITTRCPRLGHYFIVTDTKETEHNYILGLAQRIPIELQDRLVVEICKEKTIKLVQKAVDLAQTQPNYAQPWIIFDRDQVTDFDQIIEEAEKSHVRVGWSNPCIEIWFFAYFGKIPTYSTSVICCQKFAEKFKRVTHQQYNKNDPQIYQKLCTYGDQNKAIETARLRFKSHLCENGMKPSEMCPATTVQDLVEEILLKIFNK